MNFVELETEMVALMRECERENVQGGSTDKNADPRLERIGSIVMLAEVFGTPEDYKRITSHFTPPCE